MSDLVHTCGCGQKTKISEYQLGMETTCRNCKADVTYNLQNCEPIAPAVPENQVPKESDTSFSAVSGEPAQAAAVAETDDNHCSRCGTEFRGDWDRHSTIMGDICNICANRYAEDTLGTIGNPTESARTLASTAYGDDEEDPFRAMPRPEDNSSPRGPWFMEQYPVESRIVLSVLAAGVVILAIWASFQEPPSVDESDAPAAIEQREAARESLEERLQGIPNVVLISINYAFWLAGIGLSLFITLTITNKGIYESHVANAADSFVVGAVLGIIGMVPLAGWALSFLLTIWILLNRYDFRVFDFFMYIVIGGVTNTFLFAVRMAVFGAIANALR